MCIRDRYHRKPTDEEIMHFLDISIEMLENLKKTAQMAKIGSLDVSVGEDEDCSLYELIPGSIDEEEQVESMVPVSYTHLDVYKRQLCWQPLPMENLLLWRKRQKRL